MTKYGAYEQVDGVVVLCGDTVLSRWYGPAAKPNDAAGAALARPIRATARHQPIGYTLRIGRFCTRIPTGTDRGGRAEPRAEERRGGKEGGSPCRTRWS